MDLSPAVERIQDAAHRLANDRGNNTPLLADWLAVLLEDEDGRPAEILVKLAVPFDQSRDFAAQHLPHQHLAPPTHQLMARSRELSVLLRAEPTVTTDFVLLAVLESAEMVDGGLASLGASVGRIAEILTLNQSVEEFATPAVETFTIDVSIDTAATQRIIDASLNRATESLRILDDYVRFALNDQILTKEVKTLRHRLVAAITAIPGFNRLAFRDTPGDVGTIVTAGKEYVRTSAKETASINCKRLQESLRSIEEFGKPYGERFAREIESIRYRTYTLESAIFGKNDLQERIQTSRLYVLLTAAQCVGSLDWTIREAAAGGVDVFQMREKSLSDADLLERAKLIRKWTHETNTLFIMNDRPDIARLSQADGVHIGQDDLSIAAVRSIVGPDLLIGVSTHNLEQLQRAVIHGANYVGVGPVFPSRTKTFDEFPGIEFCKVAARATSLPCFALGGISKENIQEIRSAGIERVAVASAISTADEPRTAAQLLRSFLD